MHQRESGEDRLLALASNYLDYFHLQAYDST